MNGVPSAQLATVHQSTAGYCRSSAGCRQQLRLYTLFVKIPLAGLVVFNQAMDFETKVDFEYFDSSSMSFYIFFDNKLDVRKLR